MALCQLACFTTAENLLQSLTDDAMANACVTTEILVELGFHVTQHITAQSSHPQGEN